MWTAASIPRRRARPKPDPDIPQQIKGTSKNSYFVAPAPDYPIRGQAAAGAQSNQQAGFPPGQRSACPEHVEGRE